jgi:nucleotide sugar dehydrogenase
MRIGIIGFGYVGGAIAWAHRDQDIIIRDPKLKASADLDKFVDCDAVFVCVPSPCVDSTLENGKCDTSILEQTLKKLLFVLINKQIPIICKTTAPPSVYARLQKEYPNIVHCPEFLTAANNLTDYMNTEYFVLGGQYDWCVRAREVIHLGVSVTHDRFIITDIKTAALYKYMMNSYLATKVTFMNDFKLLADAEGIDWNDVKTLITYEDRIGKSHMDVPGPDGQFGWGGACFPKDIAAIIEESIELGLDFELMQRVESINKKHRK